mmetsp:Transcript_57394/g.179799  ORF Transcript_57394/g.179799 Transcript_57394/m.179799 type:complete len:235 (+) Transcript_57394:1-705(+)
MMRRKAQGLRAAFIAQQLALVTAGADGNTSADTDESGDEQAARPALLKASSSKAAASLLDDSTTDDESSAPCDPSPRLSLDSPDNEGAVDRRARAVAGTDPLGAVAGPLALPAPAAELDLLGGSAPDAAPATAPPPAVRLEELSGERGGGPASVHPAAPAPLAAPAQPAPPPPASTAVAPTHAPTPAWTPAPGGGADWLRMAEAHGLYARSAAGAGDLPAGPAQCGEVNLLLDM